MFPFHFDAVLIDNVMAQFTRGRLMALLFSVNPKDVPQIEVLKENHWWAPFLLELRYHCYLRYSGD